MIYNIYIFTNKFYVYIYTHSYVYVYRDTSLPLISICQKNTEQEFCFFFSATRLISFRERESERETEKDDFKALFR